MDLRLSNTGQSVGDGSFYDPTRTYRTIATVTLSLQRRRSICLNKMEWPIMSILTYGSSAEASATIDMLIKTFSSYVVALPALVTT